MARRSFTFRQLANVSTSPGRWELAHLHRFLLGDGWEHLCTVGPERVDPAEAYGPEPDEPSPYFGWGDLPDQHGRQWGSDDGSTTTPQHRTRRPRNVLAGGFRSPKRVRGRGVTGAGRSRAPGLGGGSQRPGLSWSLVVRR